MNKCFYIIIFIFFSFTKIHAQNLVDDDLKKLFKVHEHHVDYSKPLKNAKNEATMLISAVFLFYKTFISSQDKPSCVFTPSCSVYSMQAFQKKGLFMGWLYTFDRLTRCHPPLGKTQFYPFDNKTQRYYDPVE